MLVLSRKRDQRIMIDDRIEVQVLKIRANAVWLGFKAPADVAIHREEVYQRVSGQQGVAPVTVEASPDH